MAMAATRQAYEAATTAGPAIACLRPAAGPAQAATRPPPGHATLVPALATVAGLPGRLGGPGGGYRPPWPWPTACYLRPRPRRWQAMALALALAGHDPALTHLTQPTLAS